MENKNRQIEADARRLYAEITFHGPHTIAALRACTSLSEQELLIALGWLAHENRIAINGDTVEPLVSEFAY